MEWDAKNKMLNNAIATKLQNESEQKNRGGEGEWGCVKLMLQSDYQEFFRKCQTF